MIIVYLAILFASHKTYKIIKLISIGIFRLGSKYVIPSGYYYFSVLCFLKNNIPSGLKGKIPIGMKRSQNINRLKLNRIEDEILTAK